MVIIIIIIPFVSVRKKLKSSPWITNEYLALSRDRDYHKRKFNKLKKQYNDSCQNGDNSLKELWEKYMCLRNKANNLNEKLKKEYYHNELQNCGNDMNKSWKILKG